MHTDGNSSCSGLAVASNIGGDIASSSYQAGECGARNGAVCLKPGAPAGYQAERSVSRLASWRDSAFFLAAEQRSSLQPRGSLPCGSGSVQASESSTVVGWRSRLAAELFSSRERSCN
jgi:hypothetical protein